MKLNKKTTSITIVAIFLILVVGILLFLPFFNIPNSIKEYNAKYFQGKYIVNNYNPFNPKITTIIQLNDNEGFWISVDNYKRTGINEFTIENTINDKQNSNPYSFIDAKITGKSLDEVIKIVQTQDIEKNGYQPEKTKEQIEYEEEKKKPELCRKILRTVGLNSLDGLNIYEGMKYSEFLKQRFEGEESRTADKKYYISIASINQDFIKWNIYTGNSNDSNKDDTVITKLTKVYPDCREEEIPLSDKSNS
jgi:hypothetical protein